MYNHFMDFYLKIKTVLYWLDDSVKHGKGRKHLKTIIQAILFLDKWLNNTYGYGIFFDR